MFDAAATVEGNLIAAKSELEGLKQIYTDNNLTVRATKARVAELQSELEKIGGKGESTTSSDNGDSNGSFYPRFANCLCSASLMRTYIAVQS